MKDRVPLYPGRVKLTPVAGQENVYDMVRADQPTQEGTPLNKDSLLKDATAALFQLGADAVPDDAFKAASGRITFDRVYTSYSQYKLEEAPELASARGYIAAATAVKYALFAGGYASSNYIATVDAYSETLTKKSANNMSPARGYLAAASVGSYAVFGGGRNQSNSMSSVDAYSSTLTRTTPTVLSAARHNLAAASVGSYALFAGGDVIGGSRSNVVDAYNSSLTRSTPTVLSSARYELAAASLTEHAIFAGGYDGGNEDSVDAYNSLLTRVTPTRLSIGRSVLASAVSGRYALFAGGYTASNKESNVVDAYDSTLSRFSAPTLSATSSYFNGSKSGEFGLFRLLNLIDVYSPSLVKTTSIPVSVSYSSGAATDIAGYALFGGGSYSYKTVYAVSDIEKYTLNVMVPAWHSYSFNGEPQEFSKDGITLSFSSNSPVSGYIQPIAKTLTGKL